MSGRGHGAGPRLTETTSFTVIGLGRLLQRRLEEAMAGEGVTLRHLGALGHLRTGQGVSVTDLARRAGVAVQSMHATIDMLVARSAIDPGGETRRGRPARLSLTDEGHHLLAVASTAAAELDRTVLASLPREATDALHAVMADLVGGSGTA